jgi:CBS domain containing-hemolysin-like protein
MITLYTIAGVFFFIIHAFFTASEMAFTAVNKVKLSGLAEKGDLKAKKLNDFISKEGMFLGTTLVGTNVSVIIVTALTTRVCEEYFDAAMVPLITTIILVPLTLIFVEIVPKMIARQFSLPVSLYCITPLENFFRLFKPLILLINSIAALILKPFRAKTSSWELTFTKSDLKKLISSFHETGGVEKNEVELLHKALDFSGKTAGNVMLPLYKVSSLNDIDTIDMLKQLISLTGYSRVPVYNEKKSNMIGIANIYDVLYRTDQEPSIETVSDIIRPALFLSERESLDQVLSKLRHEKQPMGIVRDDTLKAVGVITIEDILEQLVGDIEDKAYTPSSKK